MKTPNPLTEILGSIALLLMLGLMVVLMLAC